MKHVKYKIELSKDEMQTLIDIIYDPTIPKNTVMHAKILLESDISNPEPLTKDQLAAKLGTTHTTIQFVRDKYYQSGLNAALYKNYTDNSPRWKFTPKVTEQIIELAKSQPTDNHKSWSLRRLCSECQRQCIVDSISPMTLSKLLKENNIEL